MILAILWAYIHLTDFTNLTAENAANDIMLTATIVAPVGVSSIYEKARPIIKHTADKTAEHITTLLNLLHTRIDVSAGKIIRLEIRSVPIILIPSTTVTAVRTDNTVLYNPVFTPVALAKLSSNVIAKIRLYRKTNTAITITDKTTLITVSVRLMDSILPNM